MAQPPHTPKCGQIGATRSALGVSTCSEAAAIRMPGDGVDFDRFTGKAPGT